MKGKKQAYKLRKGGRQKKKNDKNEKNKTEKKHTEKFGAQNNDQFERLRRFLGKSRIL